MDAVNPALLASLTGIAGFIIGWVIRILWHRQKVRRQAAFDADKILSQKITFLEDKISKTSDTNSKKKLQVQLDEANAALWRLLTERLRQTLKDAGLPPEEVLTADGRIQLQMQEITNLREIVEEVEALPPPTSVQDFLILGNTYYYMQQYEDAKNTYDKALGLDPNNPDTLNNRGATYAALKRYEEALSDLNRSLVLRPDHPYTLNNRGVTYDDLEKYDEALTDYNRSLKLRPDHPDILNNRGATYTKLERYDEALADYDRSLELSPDDPVTLNNRGINYLRLKKYDEALADFNRSLELKPDHPVTIYNLACLFSLWSKSEDSITYLKRAIELDGKYHEKAKTDKDFANIRDDPRFKKLIESD